MSDPQAPKQKPDKDPKRLLDSSKVRSYARYSGMAFQMGAIILLGTLAGRKLDDLLGTDPYLMVVMALLSIFAALYLSLKDLFVGPFDKNGQKKS